jgi:hypothetical protein
MAKSYEIKSGDSYWDIAKQLYGGDDAMINENRKKLQAINDGKALFAGDTLIIDGVVEPPAPQRASMPDPRGGGLQGAPVSNSMTEPRGQFGGPDMAGASDEAINPGGYKILNMPQHLLPVESPSMAPKGDPNADARMQALMMLARDRGQEAPAAQGMTGMPNMDQLGKFAQMFGAVGSQVPSMSILRQLFGGQQ